MEGEVNFSIMKVYKFVVYQSAAVNDSLNLELPFN